MKFVRIWWVWAFGRIIGLFALISISGFTAFGANAVNAADEGDAIVSEKDEVELLEDSSIAEAIDRRPDLSFANVTIDGEDSNLSLDSISADSVSSVEILKAVTPDQDADSRGGSISLRSRPNFEQSKVKTKIGLETEYDSLAKTPGYEGSVAISGPLNQKKTLGGRLSLRWEEDNRESQTLSSDWNEKTVAGSSEFVLKETRLFRNRASGTETEFGGAIDVKASEALIFFARANYLIEENSLHYPHMEYRLNRGDYLSVNRLGGVVDGAEVERGFFASTGEEKQTEIVLGGDYEQGDWEADLRFTYQDETYEQGDYVSVDFVATDVDLEYDFSSPKFPQFRALNGVDLEAAESFSVEDYTLRDRLDEESDSIVSTNIRWKNPFDVENLFFRFGAKGRSRDLSRENEYAEYDVGNSDQSFSLADVLSSGPERHLLEGRYLLNPFADRTAVAPAIESRGDIFEYDERQSRERSDFSSYSVSERVDAYYGMASMEIGKWRTLLGYRQEKTSLAFSSKEVLLGSDVDDRDGDGDLNEIVYLGTNPTFGENDYSNGFSNAHVRYRWNDRTTLIASYTNTIKRPRYSEVVPFRRVDLEDLDIEEGNPDLMPTLYRNIDFSVDVKLGEEGLMSLELFDRAVDDFIFSRKSIIAGGVYDGFELERQENSATAQIRGLELSWNHPISGPIFPDGLSLNANYVHQESELVYPSRPDEILPMTGMPDNELRVAVNYEAGKFFAQLKMAREDEHVYRVTSSPSEDRYRLVNSSMDLTVSYKLRDRTRLYLEWDNLTNEPQFDNYEGHPSRPVGYRYDPYTFSTGVKVEL